MADHLFTVSRADIFDIYPKILKEILTSEELARLRTGTTTLERSIDIPSDFEWQLKMYFRLLEYQKQINHAVEKGIPLEQLIYKRDKILWDPVIDKMISPHDSPADLQSVLDIQHKKRICPIGDGSLDFCLIDEVNLWGLEDYAKAGKLLHKPPMHVDFVDEHEMRKVYSLIYDLQEDLFRVWLMLFDLYLRKFSKRDPVCIPLKNQLFSEANLLDIEEKLFKSKTKLAASITRLRVQNNALHLSQLLPVHLQDAKVAVAVSYPVLTGWINTFKVRDKEQAIQSLNLMGLSEVPMPQDKTAKLCAIKRNQFRFDKLCPQFLSCFPNDRSKFTRIDMIQKHELILQDKTFSIGPAVFSQLLEFLQLEGDVVQSHISSPRSTAYLAALLRNNDKVKRFLVFGAGSRLGEFQQYMDDLGVDNIKLFAENFVDISVTSILLDNCVGIYACPPCSYSGIADPIDLICSRGGDLTMLEMLSESEMTDDGKQRVAQVLEEQRKTLKKAMSRPQTQFILYGTFSIVDTENQDMVQNAIDFINKKAKEKHILAAKEKARLEALAALEQFPFPMAGRRKMGSEEQLTSTATSQVTSAKLDKVNETDELTRENKSEQPSETAPASERDLESESETEESSRTKSAKLVDSIAEEEFTNIEVPLTDAFETIDLPDVCQNRDGCLDFHELGCFLTLIKRKEIVRLDSKYLIKIAELRGIFGDKNAPKKPKSKAQKRAEREAEKAREALLAAERMKKMKRRGSNLNLLLDRINAPTVASVKRSHYERISVALKRMLFFHEDYICKRHVCHHSEYDGSMFISSRLSRYGRFREWWRKAVKYIRRIRMLILDEDLDVKDLIYEGPIRVDCLPPLIFDRTIQIEVPPPVVVTPKPKIERTIYPLSLSFLEFGQNYRSEDK
uniref:CSON014079 protein n=1 Tax=Culicoides sonorensis TaxID=179676 RepID=A0A336M9L1_CULSO